MPRLPLQLVPRCAALVTGLMALVLAPNAAARDYTIRVDSDSGTVTGIGGFRPLRDSSLAAATRAFGRPDVRHETSYSCRVDWRGPNLRIEFVNLGASAAPICADRGGYAQSFVARDRAFRTRRGLRPGMRTAQVLRRHPSAEFRRGAWWLQTFVYPFGEDSEGPIVRATVRDGRVYALAGYIGAAGE